MTQCGHCRTGLTSLCSAAAVYVSALGEPDITRVLRDRGIALKNSFMSGFYCKARGCNFAVSDVVIDLFAG